MRLPGGRVLNDGEAVGPKIENAAASKAEAQQAAGIIFRTRDLLVSQPSG